MHAAPEKGFVLLMLLLLGIVLSSSFILLFIKSQKNMAHIANVVSQDVNVDNPTVNPTINAPSQTPLATTMAQPVVEHPALGSKPNRPRLRSITQ